MFNLKGQRIGDLMDGIVINLIVVIAFWIVFNKLIQAPIVSLVLAIGSSMLARLVFRSNKKVKNLMQMQQDMRGRLTVQKQVQAWSPEELFSQLLKVLEIDLEQVEQPKITSWGQHYAILRDKKLVIATGQFPGQTVGESTVAEFSEFVRKAELEAGYYFTTGTFSPNAMQLSNRNRAIELINLAGLINLFNCNNINAHVVGGNKKTLNNQQLDLREEIVSFNEKKIGKFVVTAIVLSISGVLLKGMIGYYFFGVALINLILALISIRQRRQQLRLADIGLKRLRIQ